MDNSLSFGLSVYIYKLINTITNAYDVFANSYAKSAKIKSTIKELNMLTDRDLNDIGITRADIPFIARENV